MELWVRSQDRMRLSKIKDIYIVDGDEEVAICGYSSDESDDFDLGSYYTIERALEVLDEIEYQINEVANMTDEHYIRCVYEMPKE